MNFKHPLILASSSPRRQFLLKEAGFTFTIDSPDIDESFPDSIPHEQVPKYLAEKKAKALSAKISDEIVIAADTVVLLGNNILNKPADKKQAVQMLTLLSGATHRVVTGVCLLSKNKVVTFADGTDVTFMVLSPEEIEFYIDTCKPFDKAGAYGAQDWLGMVGIEKINGSYFNVMGLPMHSVYRQLHNF